MMHHLPVLIFFKFMHMPNWGKYSQHVASCRLRFLTNPDRRTHAYRSCVAARAHIVASKIVESNTWISHRVGRGAASGAGRRLGGAARRKARPFIVRTHGTECSRARRLFGSTHLLNPIETGGGNTTNG